MKVTGIEIRNELKLLSTELSALNNNFDSYLTYIEGNTKPNVVEIGQNMLNIERKIGLYQAAQKEYNTNIPVAFKGRSITLQEAVSVIGGYSRISKLFKTASGAGKKDPYRRGSRRAVYDSSTTKQTLNTLTTQEAIDEYKRLEKDSNELRALIGKANNTVVDITWLDSALASL